MAYTGNSIVDYLGSNKQASDFGSRSALAKKYNIANYTGTAEQNTSLLNSLRNSANPSGTGMTSVKPITPVSPTAHTTPMMPGVSTNPVLKSPAAQSFMSSQMTPALGAIDPSNKLYSPAYGQSKQAPAQNSTSMYNPDGSSRILPQNTGGSVGAGVVNAGGSGAGSVSSASGITGGASGGSSGMSGGYSSSNVTTSGDTTVGSTGQGYTSPDRQAYIDAYKKYMEAQTNNADVAAAKSAYNDFITNQAKSIAGQEGRGLGIPLSLVRGTQARLKSQTDPEAARLQNAIGIAQTGQTNMVNAMKSGVDMEKGLLDFGQQDFSNRNTMSTQDRLANPSFTLGEGQTHYKYDPKTRQYTATKGPAKTYNQTSTQTSTQVKTSTNSDVNNIVSQMKQIMQKNQWAGVNPDDYAEWEKYMLDTYGTAGVAALKKGMEAVGVDVDYQ